MIEEDSYAELFELIDIFLTPKKGILLKKRSLLDNIEAFIEPSGKDFSITFDWNNYTRKGKKLDIGEYHKKVEFKLNDQSLILSDLFLRKRSLPQFTGQSSFIYTKGFSLKKQYYYRLLIPLDKQLLLHYKVEARSTIINNDILRFKVTQNNRNDYFLIIESELKQSYELFSEKAHAIKNAVGYLTGYLAGNGGYFFAYTNKKMKTPVHTYRCEFRNAIISAYSPINSNPYSYLHGNPKLAEKYYEKKLLRPVNEKELSILCQRLFDSTEFSSAIILLLESSVASLLFMPGGYAIVLEKLADIIKPDKKQKVAPLKPAISKKVRKECVKVSEDHWNNIILEFSETIEKYEKLISEDCLLVLEKYKVSISEENLETLKRRINNINKATNKAQLKRPFDFLKIKISDRDNEILSTRDDFLHGRIPDITKSGRDRSIARQNKDLYYASCRFYTLLNILILKWIGYNSRVINYPKINEDYTEIKLKEEQFREV